jgi:hypothetical protein
MRRSSPWLASTRARCNGRRFEAGTKAGRAGNVIMRAFNAVELDATPAATTRPHIGVRITASLWTIVEEEATRC